MIPNPTRDDLWQPSELAPGPAWRLVVGEGVDDEFLRVADNGVDVDAGWAVRGRAGHVRPVCPRCGIDARGRRAPRPGGSVGPSGKPSRRRPASMRRRRRPLSAWVGEDVVLVRLDGRHLPPLAPPEPGVPARRRAPARLTRWVRPRGVIRRGAPVAAASAIGLQPVELGVEHDLAGARATVEVAPRAGQVVQVLGAQLDAAEAVLVGHAGDGAEQRLPGLVGVAVVAADRGDVLGRVRCLWFHGPSVRTALRPPRSVHLCRSWRHSCTHLAASAVRDDTKWDGR